MAIVRPLSGGAARGVLDSIIQTTGPNSLQTMIAATINGSTETTFYVAAVYFGSVGIRRMRHALAAGLAADAVAMLSAVFFCSLFYKAAPASPAAAVPPAPPAITAPAAK